MKTIRGFNSLKPAAKASAAGVLMVTSMLVSGQVMAQQLPSMSEPPWTGFFSGNKQRNFEFGINNEGAMELSLMNRKKERVSHSRLIKIYPQVIVTNDDGKQFYKRLKEDEGFSTDMKPGMEHQEVKFKAEATGDAKVEIKVKYDRNKIVLDGRILDKGKLTKGKLSFAFWVRVPAMYTNTYKDERKAKAKMRKDKFRFVRAENGKRVTLKTYEKVKLLDDENAKGGVRELSVDMEGQEGHVLIFGTEDEKGILEIKHPRRADEGMLWQGYEVLWQRPFEAADSKSSIKPFVIEIK